MTVLAETCQMIAKYPSIRDYGPEYLLYATHLGDPIEFHWTNRMSSCLLNLGEYEKSD